MTEIMPEDRERIWAYVRDDLPMWETEPAIGAIPYVRASIADEHKRQRDLLLRIPTGRRAMNSKI